MSARKSSTARPASVSLSWIISSIALLVIIALVSPSSSPASKHGVNHIPTSPPGSKSLKDTPKKPVSPGVQPHISASGPSQKMTDLLQRTLTTTCSGKTILNIVAHQDDDVLFMNPDTLHSFDAGDCVRTIYLTAGDGGSDKNYALDRQRGAEAAYGVMLGSSDSWQEQTVQLRSDEQFQVAQLPSQPRASLVFLNLPDGNVNGSGFELYHHESLAKLRNGEIRWIHSIDGESRYSGSQLVTTLMAFIKVYNPSEIRTQANDTAPGIDDHSDHITTGKLTGLAAGLYRFTEPKAQLSLEFYMGYPIRALSTNVTTDDMQRKTEAFLAYARHDVMICKTPSNCNLGIYNNYLNREYSSSKESP